MWYWLLVKIQDALTSEYWEEGFFPHTSCSCCFCNQKVFFKPQIWPTLTDLISTLCKNSSSSYMWALFILFPIWLNRRIWLRQPFAKKTSKLAVSQSNIHKYVNPRVQESSAQLQLGSCHWDWAIVSLCAPSLLLVAPLPLFLPKYNKRNAYIVLEHRSVGAHVEKTLVSVGWAVFLEA